MRGVQGVSQQAPPFWRIAAGSRVEPTAVTPPPPPPQPEASALPQSESRGEDLDIRQQDRLLSATIALFAVLLLLGVVLGAYSAFKRRRLAARLAGEDARLRALVLPPPESPSGASPCDAQVRA